MSPQPALYCRPVCCLCPICCFPSYLLHLSIRYCVPLSPSPPFEISFYSSLCLSSLPPVPWRWRLYWCLVPLSYFFLCFLNNTIYFLLFLHSGPSRPQCSLTGSAALATSPIWFLFTFISPPLSVFLQLPFPSLLCFPLWLIGILSPYRPCCGFIASVE